jgi:hypothetical protein
MRLMEISARGEDVLQMRLKVPKCEIFLCSDFHDFYTIKTFWIGDFGA